MLIDLHVHSTDSDGKFTIEQILKKSECEHIEVLSITDHNKVNIVKFHDNIRIINGVEMTVKYHSMNLHLLIYNFDFNSPLTKCIQERELKNVRKYINHIKEKRKEKFIQEWISIEEAIDLAHRSKGLTVLAHPKRLKLSNRSLKDVLNQFAIWGLDGIECFHPDHSDEDVIFYASLAKYHNLIITGGSDFHGNLSDRLGYYGHDRKIDFTICHELIIHWEEQFLNKIDTNTVKLFPFWNCEGTYYYYLLRKVNMTDSLLTVFSDSYLYWDDPKINAMLEKKVYENNPWSFQPVTLKNIKNGEKLNFEYSIDKIFKNLSVNIIRYKRDQVANANEMLIEKLSLGYSIIINVDEFYIPYSAKFYHRKHNKHFLLIDSYYTENLSVIDSEYSYINTIEIRCLLEAYYSTVYKNMHIITIDLRNVENYSIENKCVYLYSDNLINLWRIPVITFLKELQKCKNPEFINFCLLGFNFNIKFKVIPYIKMLTISNIGNCLNLKQELNNLELVSNLLLYMSKKDEKKLDKIIYYLNKN